MAATVHGAIRELLEQTTTTMEALLAASDRELPLPSSHTCAQAKDVWALTAPGQWTYRAVAKHLLAVEQDSLKTLAADRAARGAR